MKFLLDVEGLRIGEVLLDAEALPRIDELLTIQTTEKHKAAQYKVVQVVHPVVMSARAVKYPVVHVRKVAT